MLLRSAKMSSASGLQIVTEKPIKTAFETTLSASRKFSHSLKGQRRRSVKS